MIRLAVIARRELHERVLGRAMQGSHPHPVQARTGMNNRDGHDREKNKECCESFNHGVLRLANQLTGTYQQVNRDKV